MMLHNFVIFLGYAAAAAAAVALLQHQYKAKNHQKWMKIIIFLSNISDNSSHIMVMITKSYVYSCINCCSSF